MLILTRQAPISSTCDPSIWIAHISTPVTNIDHWFDRDRHPFTQSNALTSFTIMWYIRAFMHCWPDPMADKFTNIAITIFLFDVFLDRSPDVADPITDFCLVDPKIHRFFCHFHQAFNFWVCFAHYIAPARITKSSMIVYYCIDFDEIAFF